MGDKKRIEKWTSKANFFIIFNSQQLNPYKNCFNIPRNLTSEEKMTFNQMGRGKKTLYLMGMFEIVERVEIFKEKN